MLNYKCHMKKNHKYTTKSSTAGLRHCLPNFKTGLESMTILRLDNPFKKYMRSNDITDMREDWMAIGGDLKRAMREYSKR